MHSPKHCLAGSGWETVEVETIRIGGGKYEVNKQVMFNAGARMLMLYCYQNAARVVASEYDSKIYLALDTITSGQPAGSIVRITIPYKMGAVEEAVKFAAAAIPEVDRCFRK